MEYYMLWTLPFSLQYLVTTRASPKQDSINGNRDDRSDDLKSSQIGYFISSYENPHLLSSSSQFQGLNSRQLQTTLSDIDLLSSSRLPHSVTVSESSTTMLSLINSDYTSTTAHASMCECDCRYAEQLQNAGKAEPNNLTSAELKQEIKQQMDKLQKEMTVNPLQLSATKRKKSSANDDRPSAKSAGYVGVGILVAIVGGLFLLDLTTMKRDVRLLRLNLRFLLKKSKLNKIEAMELTS